MPLNIEIKAHCPQPASVLAQLKALNAEYKGQDHQIDTYFEVSRGRLKLREGSIENNLIYYQRTDQAGPKSSQFKLYPVQDSASLKSLLAAAHGIKVVVDKQRHIFYIDNVKFHVDEVQHLGHFVEIEAGDLRKPMTEDQLKAQCDHYMQLLGIRSEDLIEDSYSDLLLSQKIG